MPIAIVVRNALVIVPGNEVALGVGCSKYSECVYGKLRVQLAAGKYAKFIKLKFLIEKRSMSSSVLKFRRAERLPPCRAVLLLALCQ